jgi:hypothetical protein
VPFVHEVIFNHLLNCPRLQRLLELLLNSSPVKIEAFLKSKCDKSRSASEFLWKYYLHHGRPICASDVLLRLSESSGVDTNLAERIQCLDMARQAAQRALPQSKDTVDKLSIQLDVASRVQTPLSQELGFIASDKKVAARWRSVAEQRLAELQNLQSLQSLYQIAVDFGLFHIVLVITNLSSSIQEQTISSANWVSTFFPPGCSPYSPSEMQGNSQPRQHGIFPLLMVRRCSTFFAHQGRPATMLPEAKDAHPDDFSLRAMQLLEEMGPLTKAPSTMWDVRCIGTLLEYCNCLWLKSLEPRVVAAPAPEVTNLEPPSKDSLRRAWVALKALPGRPFQYLPANVVQFYGDMITHLPQWLKDLRGMLPSDDVGCRPSLSEDDVRLHLCKVITTVIHEWSLRAEIVRGDERALADFLNVWSLSKGLLDSIASGQPPAYAPGQSSNVDAALAEEARRVEAQAHRVCPQLAASSPSRLEKPPEAAESSAAAERRLEGPSTSSSSPRTAARPEQMASSSSSSTLPPSALEQAPAQMPQGSSLFSRSFLSPLPLNRAQLSLAAPAMDRAQTFERQLPTQHLFPSEPSPQSASPPPLPPPSDAPTLG